MLITKFVSFPLMLRSGTYCAGVCGGDTPPPTFTNLVAKTEFMSEKRRLVGKLTMYRIDVVRKSKVCGGNPPSKNKQNGLGKPLIKATVDPCAPLTLNFPLVNPSGQRWH